MYLLRISPATFRLRLEFPWRTAQFPRQFHPPSSFDWIESKAGLRAGKKYKALGFWDSHLQEGCCCFAAKDNRSFPYCVAAQTSDSHFPARSSSWVEKLQVQSALAQCVRACFRPAYPSHRFRVRPAQHKLRNSLWRPFFVIPSTLVGLKGYARDIQ